MFYRSEFKYKGNYYRLIEVLAQFHHVVEEEGFSVTPRQCCKHYDYGEYFWKKALTELEKRKKVVSYRTGYNLVENNIEDRTWGFIDAYFYSKRLSENRLKLDADSSKRYQLEKKALKAEAQLRKLQSKKRK